MLEAVARAAVTRLCLTEEADPLDDLNSTLTSAFLELHFLLVF
jgi:hypothetical protein